MNDKEPIYLGDAVYAEIKNGMIELRLNDHRSEALIYLEPQVYDALKRYVEGTS